MVGEWFGIQNIPVELFQMSWGDGGFSFPSLRDRKNTLVIRTVLSMLTSLDEVTRKLMKQFEKEQARNCDTDHKEHEAHYTAGFLNCNPSLEQMDINPDVRTQSIFPRAFKAHQEDRVSFWVHNGEQFLLLRTMRSQTTCSLGPPRGAKTD
jgi:hypothetical protein